MDDLVYPRERTLGTITLVLGLLAWVLLVVGTFGGALLVLLMGFVVYVFVQSMLIAHIKGNGVELSAAQFPDLHSQFMACCERLQITTPPQAYVLNGNGGLNAFATKFLGTQYVVLLSDVVDAMSEHPDGVKFYLGHELGHLRMKHLSGHFLRWPVLWLPLLGAAYARARESTCDRHGRACCATAEDAARALAALSTGGERWKTLDMNAYLAQVRHTAGFWMSFHELNAGYPWLVKRAARVVHPDAALPARHGLALALSAFVPYSGRLGPGFSLLMMSYTVGVLAAVGLPAYQDHGVRSKLSATVTETEPVRTALGEHYLARKKVPSSLAAANQPAQLPDGSTLALNTTNMVLTARTAHGELVFTPILNDRGQVVWGCAGGEGVRAPQVPASCVPLAK